MLENPTLQVTQPEGPNPHPPEVCGGCGLQTEPRERPGITGICEPAHLPPLNPCQDCSRATELAAEQRAQAERRRERVLWTLEWAGLEPVRTPTFEDVRVDQDNRHVVARLDEFDPELTPHGYVITGAVGTGKTFLARALAARMLDRGVLHLMVSVPRFMATLRQAMGGNRHPDSPSPDALVEVAHEVDLLILDDLGAGQATTAWAEDVLWRLIDIPPGERGPKLVITTNLEAAELARADSGVGPRVASRINGGCKWMALSGRDRRARTR